MVRALMAPMAIAVVVLVLTADTVCAQNSRPGGGRLVFGGELSASIAPADDDAFFNYTDYEQDALRVGRARLFAEWRLHPSLQAVGELRLESGRAIQFNAWYLRWRPRAEWLFDIQAGRIPPVFGVYPRRAYGRDDPVVGTPLIYQYLTSLRPDAAPAGVDDLLRMRGRGWQPFFPIGSTEAGPGLPLFSAAEWSTGIEARWRHRRVEVAGSLTRGAPARPAAAESDAGAQWSGRASLDVPGGLIVGLSGARGRWMERGVVDLLDAGAARAAQAVLGVDVEYGYGRWLVRGEWVRSTFELPLVARAGGGIELVSHGGFAEIRWRPHPRWQLAGRAEYLTFGHVDGDRFADGPWDAPVERLEAAVGYRVTRRLDVRAGWQHNWRDGGRIRARGFPVAAVLLWF